MFLNICRRGQLMSTHCQWSLWSFWKMLLNSVSNAGGKSWRKQKRTHFTDVGRALLFRGKYVNLSTTDKHGWLTCAYCLGTEMKIMFKHQNSVKSVYLCLCSGWALKQREMRIYLWKAVKSSCSVYSWDCAALLALRCLLWRSSLSYDNPS